mmetsp:Transcript_1541/g.3115  ORF Transcript_1541/g.3115 Transcript_1541/m.3115 type:complete len:648 (-) Transcript_1541:81-2024(-)
MTSLPVPQQQGNPISPQHYPPPGSNPTSPTAQRTMMGTQQVVPLSMFVDNINNIMPPPQAQRSQSYTGAYAPYHHPGSATTAPRQSVGARSPTHTPRQSLVGFDPLAPGSNHGSNHGTMAPLSPSISPRIQMAMSTSPMATSPLASPSHKQHRAAHSFDAMDMNAVNKIAMEQERIRQEHNQKMRAQSVDVQATGTGKVQVTAGNGNGKEPSPKPPTGKGRKSKSPNRSRISGMFKKDKREKDKNAVPTRTSSMVEPKQRPPATTTMSLPNTPRSSGVQQQEQQRLSMYPGIASDLMDLKLGNLELPNLAKPSPTSFLTGKEDEVVRTSGEAAPFQMEIPGLPEIMVVGQLLLFVDTYRLTDQNFDLQQWVGYSRMDLRAVKIPQHIPIAQAILDCGDDIVIRGVVSKGSDEERLECVIFEGQRQFLAVFSGTHEEQAKGVSKNKKKAVPMDAAHKTVEVYGGYLEEYMKLEQEVFAILDKLTDEEPFCDVAFSGYSFGGAMATLGAFRYANARPTSRVSCLTMASPKAGFAMFQEIVKAQPNLKVMRLELGQDGKCQLPGVGGSHAGHTLVLNGSLGSKSEKVTRPVLAYEFDAPKPKKFGTKHPSLQAYLVALEEIVRLKLKWVKDFVGHSGKGVVVNNESRLVV